MNYKILQFSFTLSFSFPKETIYYNLHTDDNYYEGTFLGEEIFKENFYINKHIITKIEYKGKIYELGIEGVENISFQYKTLKTSIINGFSVVEYSEDKQLVIKNKELDKSIWIN